MKEPNMEFETKKPRPLEILQKTIHNVFLYVVNGMEKVVFSSCRVEVS